jgi:general secretion pathway protein L
MSHAFDRSVLQLHLPVGWPSADGDAEFRYARRTGDACETGVARLSEIARAKTTLAVIPASAVHFVRVCLPRLRQARLARLLPVAVEEHVATALEDIHAVLVEHVPGGDSLVMVADRAWLIALLDALARVGVHPARVIVETELAARLAAHSATSAWIVVRAAAGGFARLDAGEVIALDLGVQGSDAPLALQLARSTHRRRGETPDEILVLSEPGLPLPDFELWSRTLDLPVRGGGDWRPELIDGRGLHATDLLRGFPAIGGAAAGWSRTAKVAALAAGGIVALHALLSLGQGWRLAAEQRALRTQMEARFREIFPDAQVVVDAPLQMQRSVARLRREAGVPDAADFVPLLAAVAPALTSAGVRTERLRYERGALEVDVTPPAGATQATLAKQLVLPGYRTRIGRAAAAAAADTVTLFVQTEG